MLVQKRNLLPIGDKPDWKPAVGNRVVVRQSQHADCAGFGARERMHEYAAFGKMLLELLEVVGRRRLGGQPDGVDEWNPRAAVDRLHEISKDRGRRNVGRNPVAGHPIEQTGYASLRDREWKQSCAVEQRTASGADTLAMAQRDE